MNGDEAYYYKMINAGVAGFVLKKASSTELEEAIETVLNGNDFFSPELMKNVIINFGKASRIQNKNETKYISLTDREKEVLEFICNGLSNKEIAEQLFISHRTVEGHKAKLMEKLGAKNTSNLIILAIKNKIIEV